MELKSIRDLLSYEMFMNLAIQHLTKEKIKRMSTRRDNKRVLNDTKTILTVTDGDKEKNGRLL